VNARFNAADRYCFPFAIIFTCSLGLSLLFWSMLPAQSRS
jgi:hypothetical protein